jgi:hypothetical protein
MHPAIDQRIDGIPAGGQVDTGMEPGPAGQRMDAVTIPGIEFKMV